MSERAKAVVSTSWMPCLDCTECMGNGVEDDGYPCTGCEGTGCDSYPFCNGDHENGPAPFDGADAEGVAPSNQQRTSDQRKEPHDA